VWRVQCSVCYSVCATLQLQQLQLQLQQQYYCWLHSHYSHYSHYTPHYTLHYTDTLQTDTLLSANHSTLLHSNSTQTQPLQKWKTYSAAAAISIPINPHNTALICILFLICGGSLCLPSSLTAQLASCTAQAHFRAATLLRPTPRLTPYPANPSVDN